MFLKNVFKLNVLSCMLHATLSFLYRLLLPQVLVFYSHFVKRKVFVYMLTIIYNKINENISHPHSTLGEMATAV